MILGEINNVKVGKIEEINDRRERETEREKDYKKCGKCANQKNMSEIERAKKKTSSIQRRELGVQYRERKVKAMNNQASAIRSLADERKQKIR